VAFENYYRTTILSAETDPNKLHDLKATLDGCQVYDDTKVAQFVERYLAGPIETSSTRFLIAA
jgi:type I restriction enzyme R subunit